MNPSVTSPMSSINENVTSPEGNPMPSYQLDYDGDVERFRDLEWLLADGLGGFAMGTALGINTRRYHGLLISALHPPVGRTMMLNAVNEHLCINPESNGAEQRDYDLSTFEFKPGVLAPRGDQHLVSFEKEIDCVRWTFHLGDYRFVRELRLRWRQGGAVVRYRVTHWDSECEKPMEPMRLVLCPLVRLVDYHQLTHHADNGYEMQPSDGSPDRVHIIGPEAQVDLAVARGRFIDDSSWWYHFSYKQERLRGQDHVEDLFVPGRFEVDFRPDQSPNGYEVELSAGGAGEVESIVESSHQQDRTHHMMTITEHMRSVTPELAQRTDLLLAADDFVVPRMVGDQRLMTILAGYPWFSDWGRDTMISLPGLLLVTRRFDEALAVLTTYAEHRKNGLIPNRFDDYASGEAHYNTVDASLWFLHAACEFRRMSERFDEFDEHLLEPCLDIIHHYEHGTDHSIRMDPTDGLISAGSVDSQLTWMDAKRDGVVFTPRHGKAVEINALWYHGLRSVAECLPSSRADDVAHLNQLADHVGAHFCEAFQSEQSGGLADCLVLNDQNEWVRDEAIRPNQIFAVSLRYSPLPVELKRSVVDLCRRHLLTPVGLRTLSPDDPRYCARFAGDPFTRDGAYHQGTVWPWLMGPFVEAMLRADDYSERSREEAFTLLDRLIEEFSPPCASSLGQLFEVYDGDEAPDEPRRPGGCMAQAWSVAELVRVLALLESGV